MVGESIRADLAAEHRERRRRWSGWRADLWYVYEALKLGVRYGLRPRPRPGAVREMGVGERLGLEAGQAMRILSRSRGLAAFATVAMALGIGATATMFSISHGLLRAPPYMAPDRLVYVGWQVKGRGDDKINVTGGELQTWRAEVRTLEGLSAVHSGTMDLASEGAPPERVGGAEVTADAFAALGVPVALGRGFEPGDANSGAADEVVLGHDLWMRRFGGDAGVLGRSVRVNGVERTVVGVMPSGFRFPELEDVWVPLRLPAETTPPGTGRRVYLAFGRLRPDRTLDQAAAEFDLLGGRLVSEAPAAYEGFRPRVTRYQERFVDRSAVMTMNMLVVVASFVLLIACAGVANLLLTRSLSRSRELAVRSALGASRGRIVMQLLAESLVISAAGGVLGIGLARVGVALFNRAVGQLPFFWMSCRVDGATLAFSTALVIVGAVAAGIVPALRVTRRAPGEVMKLGGRGSSPLRVGWLSRGLLVGEVTVSFALLAMGGMMAQAPLLSWRGTQELGLDGMLTGEVVLRQSAYPGAPEWETFFEELQRRLERTPGVREAAFSSSVPGEAAPRGKFRLRGLTSDRDADLPVARNVAVSPAFFAVLGVRPLEGRVLGPDDDMGSEPVAVVNRSFVRRFFPDESPLGRQIQAGRADAAGRWLTIVGVVPDLLINGANTDAPEGFYVPMAQRPTSSAYVLLSGDGDVRGLAPGLRAAVASVDPDVPTSAVRTLREVVEESVGPAATFAALVAVFGGVALVLAAVSLFGVMAFNVRRRTREIGVRMALGARGGRVLWGAAGGAIAQVGSGLAGGMALSVVLSPALRSFFVGDRWVDPTVYGGVALTLICVGALAAVTPAWRALRVSPTEALRAE